MIALLLSRPKGEGHDPDARIYYVWFEGINSNWQVCSIHHKVWANNTHVKIRNGANVRNYLYNDLTEAITHALAWAERINKTNLSRTAVS